MKDVKRTARDKSLHGNTQLSFITKEARQVPLEGEVSRSLRIMSGPERRGFRSKGSISRDTVLLKGKHVTINLDSILQLKLWIRQ